MEYLHKQAKQLQLKLYKVQKPAWQLKLRDFGQLLQLVSMPLRRIYYNCQKSSAYLTLGSKRIHRL